nr:Eco57I restriction-modification methylase domain-containing protein [Jeotgalicoccus sp. WY2]
MNFKYKIINENFMEVGYKNSSVDIIIQNPPYKKIDSNSKIKKQLIEQQIAVSNQYAAFILIAMNLLKERGSLVAITPRSFCNGKYFVDFRVSLLKLGTFKAIHLYESRNSLFREDYVLQENIIYHLVKKIPNNQDKVTIYHSDNQQQSEVTKYIVDYAELIHPDDKEMMIRILKDERDKEIVRKSKKFKYTLEDLNISISTGPFVDFREENKYKNKDNKQLFLPYIFQNILI